MRQIRVLVVESGVVPRRTTSETLEVDPAVEVVGTAPTGALGYAKATTLGPDVVTLDVDADDSPPERTVAAIRRAVPGVVVLLVVPPTPAGARATMEAGADDYVTRPLDRDSVVGIQRMVVGHLLPRIKSLGGRAAARRHGNGDTGTRGTADGAHGRATAGTAVAPVRPTDRHPAARVPAGVPTDPHPAAGAAGQPVSPALAEVLAASGVRVDAAEPNPRATKRPRTRAYDLLLIGASTGGPEALTAVVSDLADGAGVPVLVVQHMPPGFTRLLAERLDRVTPLDVAEAEDGEPLRRGRILIAPGGTHLEVHRGPGGLTCRLTTSPPENFVRPAVDVLFRTAVGACGDGVLAVVLTGMGRDGAVGSRLVQEAGGTVVAQDEKTSVVWGMPGAVVQADLADAVLPLHEIGADLTGRLRGRR